MADLPRFDLNLLIALDALLRDRSVTRAARRIAVGQSAMSGMLKRLREQLQDPLLVRSGSELVPTRRATELEPDVRQMVLRLATMFAQEPSSDLTSARRTLKIMASEHSMMLILPTVFRAAATEAPNLSFDIRSLDAPTMRIAADDIDLCLTAEPISTLGRSMSDVLRTQKVLVDPFVAVVDHRHPFGGPTISLDELRGYPHVITHFPGMARSVEDIILHGAAPCTAAIRVPSFLAVAPGIIGSERVGIIPSMLRPLVISVWKLRTIALPDEVPPSIVRALWHVRNDADPVHKWLRRAVRDACVSMADD